MAFNVLHWLRAFTDERLGWPCQYRMVAIVLGMHANKGGEAWPGVRAIEAESGTRRPTVIKVIRMLENGGWLTRATTHGKLTQYKLVSHVDQCPMLTVGPRLPRGQPGPTAGGQPGPTNPLSTIPQLPLIIASGAETAPTEKKPDPLNPQVKEIFTSLKEARGYDSPRRPAEAHAIRQMLLAGHDVSTILACWRAKKAESFWADKELFMMTIHTQVGAWKGARDGPQPAQEVRRGRPGRHTPEPYKQEAAKIAARERERDAAAARKDGTP